MRLALDPSLTGFGYCVFTHDKVIARGCIKTDKVDGVPIYKSNMIRVETIFSKLRDICRKHNIKEIVSEAPVGSKSAQAAQALALCLGAVTGLAVTLQIPLQVYNAQTLRTKILKNRWASKDDIRAWAEANVPGLQDLNTLPKYIQEAIADASLVGYYASTL